MAISGIIKGNGGKAKQPRIVLYGPGGVGKSTFGADAEFPVFITTEDGVDNIDVDRYAKASSWTALMANVRQISEDKHNYKTIVLDTLDGAAELCAQHICASVYGGNWEAKRGVDGFMSYSKGWLLVAEEMQLLRDELDACRNRGMCVILLAHTGLMSVKSPIDGEYQKFAPDCDKRVWSGFCSWADIVLRADYECAVLRDKTKGRTVASSSTRWMYCAGGAAADEKCRVGYELPPKMALSWAELQQHLGSKSATLDEVKSLWAVLTAEEQQKAMAWLGVANIEDASLSKMKQLLNRIRQKQADRELAENTENKEESK